MRFFFHHLYGCAYKWQKIPDIAKSVYLTFTSVQKYITCDLIDLILFHTYFSFHLHTNRRGEVVIRMGLEGSKTKSLILCHEGFFRKFSTFFRSLIFKQFFFHKKPFNFNTTSYWIVCLLPFITLSFETNFSSTSNVKVLDYRLPYESGKFVIKKPKKV